MKLLKDNAALHQEEFSNASPYVIMFGPDKCGATNKVRYKQPASHNCTKYLDGSEYAGQYELDDSSGS